MNLIEELITATKDGKLIWVFDSDVNTYHEHSLGMFVSMWVINIDGIDIYNAKAVHDLRDLRMVIEKSISLRETKAREDVIQQLMTQLAAL